MISLIAATHLCKRILLRNKSVLYYLQNNKNHFTTEELTEVEKYDNDYNQLVTTCFKTLQDHNCLIIHPYVKWGKHKVRDTDSKKQIEEAVSLINTLHPWKVHDTIAVPLPNLDKKQIFGSGTMMKLKGQIRSNPHITAVFVNVSTLLNTQQSELEKNFGVPIFDRYKIVMQILRLHATSKHSKLQVALAETQYLMANLKNLNISFTSHNLETRRMMLQSREQKIKDAIKKLHTQRQLLRHKRNENEIPVVAVIGYTNAGKTSLIKALTGDDNLVPKNVLFATLDVTHHATVLPSNLKVLFVDTVGFISDIPTNLIECFIVTLEDALVADVILHIEDLSSDDLIHQRNHVYDVLNNLSEKSGMINVFDKVIVVGNKCDVMKKDITDENIIKVSAKTFYGIEDLKFKINEKLLQLTKRSVMTIRVPAGGDEMRWLYKNSAVTSASADESNSQYQKLKIIISDLMFIKFKNIFLQKK